MPQTKDQKRRKAIDRHTKCAEYWENKASDYSDQILILPNTSSELYKRLIKLKEGALKTMEAHNTIVSNTRTALGR
jgi:hypothetical protein